MSYINLHNGKIYTGDAENPIVEAMMIDGNTITEVGSSKQFSEFISPDLIDIDLKGHSVFPGFTDSHLHLTEWAKREDQLNLEPFDSLKELLNYIRENAPQSEWILGGGWNHNLWIENCLPTAEDLSFLNQDSKAIFFSKDFHSAWVNDAVIDHLHPKELAKFIDKKLVDINELGQVTGIFKEEAMMELIVPLIDSQESPLFKKSQEMFEKYFEMGITSIHSMETYENYRRLRALYQNPLNRGPRLGIYIYHHDKNHILDFNMKSGDGASWFKFLGLKYFIDGALGSQTALMEKSYEGSQNTGVSLWKQSDISREIRENYLDSLKVAIHAIGDKATAMAINILEKGTSVNHIPDRIEHAQLLSPELLKKLSKTHIHLVVNPSHLPTDKPTAEKYWGERSRYAFAFRSMLEHNIPFAFASDAPVETINPWKGIYAAVYRIPINGTMSWYGEETISLDEAISAVTINHAELSGESEILGKLLPGYLADLFVASDDPFEAEPNKWPDIRSLLTMIDGKIVYNTLTNKLK